jgi:hypothetical protein
VLLNAFSAEAQNFCCIALRVTRGLVSNPQVGIPGVDQAAGLDQAAAMVVVVTEVQFLRARRVAVIPRLR